MRRSTATAYHYVSDGFFNRTYLRLADPDGKLLTSVFVAEALLIGVVARSLGCFLGLTSYPLMTMFAPFGVKQKVKAIWGILAFSLSIVIAVLGSALPTTKASVITTPLLLKR